MRRYTAGPLVWNVQGEKVLVSDLRGDPIATYHYADESTADEMARRAASREQTMPYQDSFAMNPGREDVDWRREVVVGAKVFRRHPHDGTSQAGKPVGPQLSVVKIEDQVDQYGTVQQKNAVALLSDNTWEFRWNLIPDSELSKWKHAAASASSVTQEDMERMNALVAKMERAASTAGREDTNTADLTPEERSEYRILRDKFDAALDDDFQGEFHGIGDEEIGNNPDEEELGENPRRLETGRATRIWQDSAGNTHVRYHNTDVVSFNQNWITLRTGGWDTVTTRARMNLAAQHFNLGYQVYRLRGVTYVSWGRQRYELGEVLSLDVQNIIVNPDDMVPPTSEMPRRRGRTASAGVVPMSVGDRIRDSVRRRSEEREREARGQRLGFEEGEWEESERNPPKEKNADVLVNDHGSVVIVMPLSGASRDWWEANVQEGQRWGSGYAVDRRCVESILQAMQEAGFRILVS